MNILGYSGGTIRVGKIVSTTWPNVSSTYIAVFADGGTQTMSVQDAVHRSMWFLTTPGVTPIRVVIRDKAFGRHFEANEGDITRIRKRSEFPGAPVVEYVDADHRGAVGVSVAQNYLDKMHIGISFGKHVIHGQVVYLVIFDDGACRGMSYKVITKAAETFLTGYTCGTYVPIMAML